MYPTGPTDLESISSLKSYRSFEISRPELDNNNNNNDNHDARPNIPGQKGTPKVKSPSRPHSLPDLTREHEDLTGETINKNTAPSDGQPTEKMETPCSGKKPPSESSQSQEPLGLCEKAAREPEHSTQQISVAHQKNKKHSIAKKAKTLATRLFHPLFLFHAERAEGDPNVLDPDDPENENLPASVEAQQLVRGLVYNPPNERSTTRQQLQQPLERGPSNCESEGGILAQLLKLYGSVDVPMNDTKSHKKGFSAARTPNTPSGWRTPGKAVHWKPKPRWLEEEGTSMNTTVNDGACPSRNSPANLKETPNATLDWGGEHREHDIRLEDEIRVTVQIADIISRRRYIIQLCKALIMFGAPMHRLEEHMQKTASVLEMDCQFLYVPGCMIMSFDDPTTRTTEVKLVRVAQGIDLGLLADTHDVYKNVIHDAMGIEEARTELDRITTSKPRFNKWIIVMVYGIASAMVGPFAFNARPIDMPIIFFNGALLGILQHVLAPRSVLYSNIFEVTASVLTSFVARGLGSIQFTTHDGNREHLFCFSAVAQSSVALILPGYTVLSSSLELQSHQLVAGSIRMVYAIIYSLFLGYGITVGFTIYGLIDPGATSVITCPTRGVWGNEYLQRFPFVAAFVLCLLVVNQGRWKQAPVMLFIAESGYIVTYFVTQRIGTSSQVANTVGAFTIGMLGNLYSRVWHGHAATSILPGIFVLVPSGLAASGPLISGIKSADETRSNISSAIIHNSSSVYSMEASQVYTADLGLGMVEVSIGITVGLFIAALAIYPFGKRRSGLFSF
ncbi:DUF1212 domain membrane protein [Penicillium verhagenii]|uniref:DUF1212 domain membrane protein n=1 Tax=Penicillium verhagenii TaxID=1562060 RepID=UPI002545A8AF|nr:DUF1212 domain membrane protein [Penicillium verhagenii]KAJ5930254.1 DUF1212 domain membrane protein [Penicillium verhagenii]